MAECRVMLGVPLWDADTRPGTQTITTLSRRHTADLCFNLWFTRKVIDIYLSLSFCQLVVFIIILIFRHFFTLHFWLNELAFSTHPSQHESARIINFISPIGSQHKKTQKLKHSSNKQNKPRIPRKLPNSGYSLNWSTIDEVTTRNTTAYFLAHSIVRTLYIVYTIYLL